jgi:sulfide:quinone oxidoreductase
MPALLSPTHTDHHKVVIVGAGAAGIATASSLISRDPSLDIALIDPADVHYYQPGWTMVGAGVFKAPSTARTMASAIPRGVHWVKARVQGFDPSGQLVLLEDGRAISYEQLVVCPGLKLDWDAIAGLSETLGRNGVTSNYRYDLAPYTWQLVQNLKRGRALFTQPPMPIKCAGAPQKALYLSCDHWLRHGHLGNVKASFFNAGAVLFGVPDYVPALMAYIDRLRPTSFARAHWPMPLAGSMSTHRPCAIASSPMSMLWATWPTPAMPRPPPPPASRHR